MTVWERKLNKKYGGLNAEECKGLRASVFSNEIRLCTAASLGSER